MTRTLYTNVPGMPLGLRIQAQMPTKLKVIWRLVVSRSYAKAKTADCACSKTPMAT